MKRPVFLIGLAVAALACGAGPVRLDDSLTHTVPPNVQMQWRPMQASAGPAGSMEAWLRVNVRVDTAAWAGQSGRWSHPAEPVCRGPKVVWSERHRWMLSETTRSGSMVFDSRFFGLYRPAPAG